MYLTVNQKIGATIRSPEGLENTPFNPLILFFNLCLSFLGWAERTVKGGCWTEGGHTNCFFSA